MLLHGFQDAADSAGAGWFNLKAPKLTEELKQDLKALALRNFVDPKRFYKKDKSLGKIPKFFQASVSRFFAIGNRLRVHVNEMPPQRNSDFQQNA